MGLLKLLPAGLRQQLLLKGLLSAFQSLEAQHLGTQLRDALDAKYGQETIDPIQKRVAVWLKSVAAEVEA